MFVHEQIVYGAQGETPQRRHGHKIRTSARPPCVIYVPQQQPHRKAEATYSRALGICAGGGGRGKRKKKAHTAQ